MISLSFLILCLLIVGCSTEQPHSEFLSRAEQSVFEHPDSVVRMLAPRWYDTKMNEADRALYGLLYTEALHRSGLFTEADSLILFSRQYYRRKVMMNTCRGHCSTMPSSSTNRSRPTRLC
jgi:hypothetical protein